MTGPCETGKPLVAIAPLAREDRAVVASEGGMVATWTRRQDEPTLVLAAEGPRVLALVTCPKRALVAAASADRRVRVWSLEPPQEIAELDLTPSDDTPLSLAFSGDGTKLYVGIEQGAVLELDVKLDAK